MIKEDAERWQLELLLPWYAAGTLSRSESDCVEKALAGDVELARRYALVLEELAETINLNEALGEPSASVAETLFAAIDVEEAMHFIALRRTTLRRRQPGQTSLNSARSSTAPSANSRHWGASWWRPAGSRRRCFSAGFTPARSAAPSPSLHQFEPRNLRQPPICTVLFQSRDLSAIACPDVCLSLVPAALKPRLIASVICWGTARILRTAHLGIV